MPSCLCNVTHNPFKTYYAPASRPLTIQAPDLNLTDVRPNAATAVFGEAVGLDFTVRNTGTGPTTATVRDRVWLSRDQVLDGGDTLLTTADAVSLPVAAGGQYQRGNFLVNLPLSAGLSAGAYYVIVQADALGGQPESNEANNVTAAATPINVTFPPLPDLHVTNITVDEAAANTLQSGGPMTIRWLTRNDGAAPVGSVFHERVVVTNGSQTLLNTTVTYDATGAGAIDVGGSVARSFAFTLPDGTPGAGTLTVSVTTDSNNEIVEGFSGTAPETNNTTAASFTSALRPYPDLVVNALAVSPTAVQTGQAVTVSWRTDNTGSAAAGQAFSERVRVVNPANGRVLVDQTVAYDPAAGGAIAAGDGRIRSLTVTIPDGSASVGTLSVTVTTDQANNVFEYNPSGTGESNNSATASLAVTLAPYPDLVASDVTGPTGEIVADPAHVTVGWKVTNAGSLQAQSANWVDIVYASRDTTFGNGDDVEVARFARTAALAPGAAYTRSEDVVLPPAFTGRFYLFVKAD